MALAHAVTEADDVISTIRPESEDLLRNVPAICVLLYAMGLVQLIVQRCFFGVDISPHLLGQIWQMPATNLILEHPIASAWYWHMAASGFIAYWSLLLNLFGEYRAPQIYQWINVFVGAGMGSMAYVITLALCRSRLAAIITGVVVLLSPTLPFAAAYYLYDGPSLYLLTGAATAIALYQLSGRRVVFLVTAMWLGAALVCLRSFFHLGLLVPLLGAIFLVRSTRLQKISSVVALLFPLTLYAKNWFLFGVFGASTTLGLNFSKLAIWNQPPELLQQMKASGQIAPIVADYPLFYDIHAHHEIYEAYGYTAKSPYVMLNQNDGDIARQTFDDLHRR